MPTVEPRKKKGVDVYLAAAHLYCYGIKDWREIAAACRIDVKVARSCRHRWPIPSEPITLSRTVYCENCRADILIVPCIACRCAGRPYFYSIRSPQ